MSKNKPKRDRQETPFKVELFLSDIALLLRGGKCIFADDENGCVEIRCQESFGDDMDEALETLSQWWDL